MKKIYIGKSRIDGKGIFAMEDIHKGERIQYIKGKLVKHIIKNKDGSAYQTDLIKETGFSKVKISRVLDRLEAKDILERKRRGMTNIIVLK